MESNNSENLEETKAPGNQSSPSKRVLIFGALTVVSVAAISLGWLGFSEFRINSLVDQTRSSITDGQLEDAESNITALQELDPDNESLPELQSELDFSTRFQAYENALVADNLDTALSELQLAIEIKPSNELEIAKEEVESLQDSKGHFERGSELFEAGSYKMAFAQFEQVIEADSVRYEEAQELYDESVDFYLGESKAAIESELGKNDLRALKLASQVTDDFPQASDFEELRIKAEKGYASSVRAEAEKHVDSGFFISAFKTVDKAQSELGQNSSAARELGDWFNPIFEDAKESALRNDMVKRTDSFTGSSDYYYRGTYRTIGDFLLAQDRFRLGIEGESNPRLFLDVMLYQDDWVFADSIQANIDGSIWTVATDSFFGDSIERDNGSGYIWEYTYRYASASDIDKFLQARESKRTVIRFQGDQGRSDFTVTSTMKRGIEKVLLAYLALGGSSSLVL